MEKAASDIISAIDILLSLLNRLEKENQKQMAAKVLSLESFRVIRGSIEEKQED